MLRRVISLGLAALVLAADQASKRWALEVLGPGHHRTVQVVSGCFQLAYAENRSAAFGILGFLPLELRRNLLTGFAVVALLVLLALLARGRIRRTGRAVAPGRSRGGAIGNVIDRVRLGYVVDFIDWHLGDSYHWPTFNIADSGIVVGVFVLLWISYWVARTAQKAEPKTEAAAK